MSFDFVCATVITTLLLLSHRATVYSGNQA